MKKQILFMLVGLSLMAIPLWATDSQNDTEQAAHHSLATKTIKLHISGSAIPLADPLAGPFPILINVEGAGNIGHISSQGICLYAPLVFGPEGKSDLQLLEGQSSYRLEINGEVLLGIIDPGVTGWIQITDLATGFAVWEQTWTGKIVGGTGRFAGIKGAFKKSARGFAVLFTEYGPAGAVVQPWQGTMEIRLEKWQKAFGVEDEPR